MTPLATPRTPPVPPSPEGNVVVFVGPTLDVASARQALDATFLPPAACGDIYRVTARRPWAIGLIDGYFHHTPSVWHKEILWAMQRGVHVFGSASMGALRAAELETFGMVGVGEVFAAFRDGTLENDDEVAIVHRVPQPGETTPGESTPGESTPGESTPGVDTLSYEAQSEALVNIRKTLEVAEQQGILRLEEVVGMVQLMQDCFYAERSYERLLHLAAERDDLSDAARRLAPWLAQGRVDLKRIDALAMLRLMASQRASSAASKEIHFTFQRTTMWLQMCSRTERPVEPSGTPAVTSSSDALLDELKLRVTPYRQARTHALSRLWALEVAERRGLALAEDAETLETRRRALAEGLRGELGPEDDLEAWVARQGLNGAMLDRLLSDEAQIRRLEEMAAWSLPMQLLDHLRLRGLYGTWSELAQRKDQLLKSRGLAPPSLATLGLDEETLWSWYFESQLQRDVPDDLNAYASNLDFSGVDALRQAVLREYCWQRENPQAASDFATFLSPTRSPHDRP